MEKNETVNLPLANRRRFLKQGAVTAGAAAALWRGALPVFADDGDEERNRQLTGGDIAILRLLAAAELIESDLWLQYSELGGVQDTEVSGVNGGNALYMNALTILDGDMPQYIHDNTDDEFSHARFLNNYLKSKGAEPVDLSRFANIPGSTAAGSSRKLRLTNLTKLTVDTSFWSRYRSITNPDFDPGAKFVQAVPSLNTGQHTAIPRNDNDTAGSTVSSTNPASTISTHLQAIAFTAGFHFAFIEQGGTSLYATMAQKVTSLEVLRIVVSIGGSEIMHFQTWQDKAGNALPLTDVDPVNKSVATFTDLKMGKGETVPQSLQGDTLQANLIMPEPTHFINPKLGPVAIIRPSSVKNSGAVAAIMGFAKDGLFVGQPDPEFLRFVLNLAEEADEARRRN